MKTYLVQDDDGKSIAFEIDIGYVTKKHLSKLLKGIDQVSNVKIRKPFQSPDDVHVEFDFQEQEFMVWEAFGDNSRYWIGPKDTNCQVDVIPLQSTFEKYQPPLIYKIRGDLFSLNFASLFGK